ncbi:MAG: hypothetical protein ABSB40_10680 [Nitrososphaeria archaeon]|jgi:hypothetical protein
MDEKDFLEFLDKKLDEILKICSEIKGNKISEKVECNKWVQTEGKNGLYEKLEKNDSIEYQNLLKDLENHKGKIVKEGFFYWIFDSDNKTIGRKPKR